VDGGLRTQIAAIDRATGAKRVLAELPFAIRPILATAQALFVSEALALPQSGLFYRVARTGTEEAVRLLPAAEAITTAGEYIYGIDDRAAGTRSFRVKVSDLETMTPEEAAGSPLIELTDPDVFVPVLANKSALYMRTQLAPGLQHVVLQSAWPKGQRSLISTSIRQAAINDDSIFFIDGDVSLKQKIHGSTNVTLTLIERTLVEDRALIADANHIYFGGPAGLGRVTTAGVITTVANALGTWVHQDARCVYAQGNNYAAFAK
jgi:hypothetical protein